MAHPFIEHLLEDHEKQRSIAGRLKEAKQSKVRNDLRQKMSDELLPHMAGEEASIFTYIRGSADAEAVEHALDAVQAIVLVFQLVSGRRRVRAAYGETQCCNLKI